MNRLIALTLSLFVIAVLPAQAQEHEISDLESRPTVMGPSDYFTGTAIIEPLFDPRGPTRAGAAKVTFAPGARSAWHSHPRGQRLVITSGHGWVQRRNAERREVESGDVVWTPQGVVHWHGATTTHSMSHIAIQEERDSSVVNWMDNVTDEEYQPE